MSNRQNWSSVIHKVETANIQNDQLEKQIKRLNKIAYKQQLDRQLEFKYQEKSLQSIEKQKELHQARILAEAQQRAKQQQKYRNTQMHRQFGNQNQSLLHLQQNIKSTTKKIDIQNVRNYLEHPFVKLVDKQDARMKSLKQKFIKQNQINHIQQELKNKQKNANRYQEWQEKNKFIDYVESNHAKRSEERQRFKNKYLRIKRAEDPTHQIALSPQPVEKTYMKYLNEQINQNNQRRIEQKQQLIDPKINPFYSSNNLEPDSSPAFLGRNPLSHQRKRQLYYINKHLNTQHQRSYTAAVEKKNNQRSDKRQQSEKSSDFVQLSRRLNPQLNFSQIMNGKKFYDQILRNQQNQSQSLHLRSHAFSNRQKIQTEVKERKNDFFKQPQSHQFFKSQKSENLQSSKRMKSQFIAQSFTNDYKLPEISKKSYEPTSNSLRINVPSVLQDRVQVAKKPQQRRQFFRFDPITGKQATVLV